MHDGVHAAEQIGRGMLRVPTLVGARRIAAHQPDHPVTAGGQESRQRGADKSGGSGDGDGHTTGTGRVSVGGEVLGKLAVPIGEGGAQRGTRHGGVDDVVDAGGPLPSVLHRRRHSGGGAATQPITRGGHVIRPSDESTSTNWCGGFHNRPGRVGRSSAGRLRQSEDRLPISQGVGFLLADAEIDAVYIATPPGGTQIIYPTCGSCRQTCLCGKADGDESRRV